MTACQLIAMKPAPPPAPACTDDPTQPPAPRAVPGLVAGAYALLGASWIFFSDRLAAALSSDAATMRVLSTYKGWFYVAVTAVLLYVVLRRYTGAMVAANDALRQSRDSLGATLDAAPVAILDLDHQGRVYSIWNRTAERMFGWSRDEVIGRSLPVVPPERQEEFRSLFRRLLQGETLSNVELRRVHKDGRPVEVSLSTATLRDSAGRVTRLLGALMDITSRKRTDAALRDSAEFNRQIIVHAQEGILVLDTNRRFVLWNPYLERITGVPSARVLGMNAVDSPTLFPWVEKVRLTRVLTEVLQGQTVEIPEHTFQVPSTGSSGRTTAKFTPLLDSLGRVVGILGTVHLIELIRGTDNPAPET